MRYSRAIKESVLKKVLPPENRSIHEVSQEFGISENTIRSWMQKVSSGILALDAEIGPGQLGMKEKFHLVMEAASLGEEELGVFLREKGIHSEHLNLWKQELRETMADNNQKEKQELKAAKKEIRNLNKELDRKEKALAEMAALLALKKKLHTIFEEDEEN
jgi:transposase-like protein